MLHSPLVVLSLPSHNMPGVICLKRFESCSKDRVSLRFKSDTIMASVNVIICTAICSMKASLPAKKTKKDGFGFQEAYCNLRSACNSCKSGSCRPVAEWRNQLDR